MHTLQSTRRFLALTFVTLILSLSTNSHAADKPLEGIPSGDYAVDLSHASVIWKVSHFGFSTYVGRFNDFSADLSLDSKDFSKSRVNVDIKVDSIATAYPFVEKEDFDKVLATEWFKSADHPSITFKTTSVSALSDNTSSVEGEMTMLGQTHPVTLAVTLNKATAKHPFLEAAAVGFSASTEIDRTVWGLSKYAPGIGAKVIVEIEGEFIKK